MWSWGQKEVPERERKSYFDQIGCDIEIIKTVLLLTGALHGTKNSVNEYLSGFKIYDWIWKDDKETAYKKFLNFKGKKGPQISDFEEELKKFLELLEEIANIGEINVMGALTLKTANIKHQLCTETKCWKVLYSQKILQIARKKMEDLYEYMRLMSNKLNIEVQSVDTLRYVMDVLKEIRDKESSMEMEVMPILDLYAMLEHYLPDGSIDKSEIERKGQMLVAWKKVCEHSDVVSNGIVTLQGTYKKQLLWDIREFSLDIRQLRKDWDEHGPMTPGIKSWAAVERLKKFKDEWAVRDRRMEMYRDGETLFALRPTRFNEVVKTRKEIQLIDQ